MADDVTMGLGFIPSPKDPRDEAFLMADALAGGQLPGYRYWLGPDEPLNQGAEGHCTAFAWSQWGITRPVLFPVTNAEAHALYWRCKEVDGIPNIEGTYPRVCMKLLQDDGRIGRYLWARNAEDLAQWILTNGPVVVGTRWTQGMYTPNAALQVFPTGGIVGGHAYLLTGFSRPRNEFQMLNSWGPTWGRNGRAWIPYEVMVDLMSDGYGEGCGAEEIS